MVGWTGTDVTTTNELGVDRDIPNEGRTEFLGGVEVIEDAMDATPEIIILEVR